jgi:hypothetical protein
MILISAELAHDIILKRFKSSLGRSHKPEKFSFDVVADCWPALQMYRVFQRIVRDTRKNFRLFSYKSSLNAFGERLLV